MGMQINVADMKAIEERQLMGKWDLLCVTFQPSTEKASKIFENQKRRIQIKKYIACSM